MNSLTIKFTGFLLSFLVLAAITSQVYFAIKEDNTAVYAVSYNTKDSISFDGVFVRNETAINSNANGAVGYLGKDGDKFAANSIIANVYSSESDITNLAQIESLKNQLKLYERVTSQGTIVQAQPEFLKQQINTLYIELNKCLQNNNYVLADEKEQEINSIMCIYNVCIGSENMQDYEARKKEISSKISELTKQVNAPISVIKTEKSGYFVSYTDDYETKLNKSNIDKLTSQDIENILSAKIVKNYDCIGKIIDSYKWNIVGIIDACDNVKINKQVSLVIDGINNISGVITGYDRLEDGRYKINIECEEIYYNIVQNRTGKVEVIFNQYDGIKIPRNAINFKDGVRGVYVICGQEVSFKNIDVIYEGEDYIISRITTDKKYVVVNDQLVFEGDGNFGKS